MNGPCLGVDQVFVHVSQPVQDLSIHGFAFEFLPFCGSIEALLERAVTDLPRPDQKIKITIPASAVPVTVSVGASEASL